MKADGFKIRLKLAVDFLNVSGQVNFRFEVKILNKDICFAPKIL